MQVINLPRVLTTWHSAAMAVVALGHESEDTRELIGVSLDLSNAGYSWSRRGFNQELASKMAQVAIGQASVDEVRPLIPERNLTFWDEHPFEGPYLAENLSGILDQLEMHQPTRRCILTLPEEYCISSLQFFVRRGALYTVGYQRSCDLMLGLPYDAYVISTYARQIEMSLGLGAMGPITHNVGSLHIYNRDWNTLLECL